jgi:hypothetical protein
VAIAERAVAMVPRNFHYLNTLGAVLYRSGRFEKPAVRLRQSTAAAYGRGSVTDWLFFSMVELHRGHAEEARRCWMAADAMVADARRRGGPLSWQEALESQLLPREAEGMLLGAVFPSERFARRTGLMNRIRAIRGPVTG